MRGPADKKPVSRLFLCLQDLLADYGRITPGHHAILAPGPHEGTAVGPAALEIELGRDIRVHIAATAPKEFASVIIKALAAQ